MPEAKLIALYPHPTDIEKFNQDYEAHMKLLQESMQFPEGVTPYSVTRFFETPMGKPMYFQMFMITFPSIEAMQQSLGSPGGQALAADAMRISSGGPPIFLFGCKLRALSAAPVLPVSK